MRRRTFLAGAGLLALAGERVNATTTGADAMARDERERTEEGGTDGMYGIIGKMVAQPGRREELVGILLAGTRDMPGCRSYVVAKDLENPDALWVTEVWDDRESHAASLQLPQVQEAMAAGRPLIAEFGEGFETAPMGGHGLG